MDNGANDEFETAAKRWAAWKLKVLPADIKRVDIDTGDGGYCETCSYAFVAALVTLNNGKYHEIDIEGGLGAFLKEVLSVPSETESK